MKIINSKISKVTSLISLTAFLSFSANAQDNQFTNITRDPFTPFDFSNPVIAHDEMDSTKVNNNASNPLERRGLSSYTLIGLMIAPKKAIAIIKGYDKNEYFVTIGDKIGSEGGVISAITSKGITVKLDNDTKILNVQNQFEVQNGL